MEHLPQTKGKGVLMFAKRRQRMDELSTEQEEMRQKGAPVDAAVKQEGETVNPPPQEESTQAPQDIYVRQPLQQQMLPQSANGMNGPDPHRGSAVPRSLVSNRTAKPFMGGHNQGQKSFSPVRGVSTPKKPENIFKVPVPVNTTPQVWSPTSDIIASRDERIAIPAIKTGILPETKRRGANKTDSKEMHPLQKKKGKQKSVPEEDFLSLGAEACNFMQAPRIKQKNPPPVLPKPVINPARPIWSAESPLAASSSVPAMGHTQVHAVPQQSPPNLHQSAPEPSHTPVSLHASPTPSKTLWIRSQNDASCPPQHLNTSKSFPKGYSSDAGASEGLILKGKGAELFARRQSRMEKFVVDDETVRANKTRSSSPTLSMPSTWKYSSNVHAPPPVSYNPILSPFYPLTAVKQPLPSTSPKMKPKANKEKKNPPPKHLNVLDVMKHQPYQLNSSLFTYNSTPDAKEAVYPKESKQTPASFQPQSLACEPSTAFSRSPNSSQSVKQNLVSVLYPCVPQSASNEATITPQQLHGEQQYNNTTGSGVNVCVGSSLPVNYEYASRCAIPVAPRPKFSAKNSNTGGKQWKPGFIRSRSLSFPQRLSSVSPVSTPGVLSTHESLSRQYSWVEQPKKTLSEVVSQSLFGPEESKISAAHRKSLPETAAEWKQRVLYESAGGPQEMGPVIAVTSPTNSFTSVPKEPVGYEPPFRPSQPLVTRYSRGSSLPHHFTPYTNYPQSQRVSWKL